MAGRRPGTSSLIACIGAGAALAALALSCHATRPAPLTLDGSWEGSVTVRGKARQIAVVFAPGAGSGASPAAPPSTVSIPDEYALDDPLSKVTQNGAAVHFELPGELQPGTFDGTLERGRLSGSFTGEQDGDALTGTFELWRRPSAHPSYRTEEVTFRGGEGRLAGTLFVPAAPGPAIVFYHGSGPQTRDSYIRYFAARFARDGVAALIYDKRGTGASEGADYKRSSASFDDLARDGLAGIALLKQRSDIDAKRIGVWGLSQGAWLVALAALQSPDVAFVVMLSGGGVSPARQELYDDDVKLRALGYSEAQIADALATLRLGDEYVRDGSDANWDKVQASLASAKQQPWFRYLDKFPLVLPREAWWHGADLDYDPRPTLRKIHVPVLAILGKGDMSTPAEETAERIRDALRDGGNMDVTVTVVPNADHAIQIAPDPWLRIRLAGAGGSPAPSQAAPEWDWARPAPGWEDAMAAWVAKRAIRAL